MTTTQRLSGRIDAAPAQVWDEEVLTPQFEAELATLFGPYLLVEKALLAEGRRLGVVEDADARRIAAVLDEMREGDLAADPRTNMSDIAFAIERHVRTRLGAVAPAWHVDRSRNDFQACAQTMFGRDRLLDLAEAMLDLTESVIARAREYTDTPMPGYTHWQPAQVVTPGFHLSALADELLHVVRRLAASHAEADACPLGAGAMAGQELSWDRTRLAALLGFGSSRRHALVAVASRSWVLGAAGDLSVFGVVLSRFVTDLMSWGSGPYGFLDLPDELCGISSAMPQKRNFPVLERIRGRTAHLTSLAADLAIGQRGTPYTNMVEVSKEAGTHFRTLLATTASVLRLTSAVVGGMRFRIDRMAAACEDDYLGGFTLANALTLREGLEWREAQVVTGLYITAALGSGLRPAEGDPDLLRQVAHERGHALAAPRELLADAFEPAGALTRKSTAGSTHPDEVRAMLAAQSGECHALRSEWQVRRRRLVRARADLDAQLGLRPGTAEDSAVGRPE